MKTHPKIRYSKQGFTLLEMIIYMAIAVMVLISVVGIGMNLSLANQKSQAKREVYMNARFIVNEVTRKVRGAQDILPTGTVYGSNPGSLALSYPSGNNILIETYTKNVTVGGVTVPIVKLSMKEGSGTFTDISSDKVTISNFTITNLTSSGSRKNINIQMTIDKVNPSTDKDFGGSIQFETSISTRK